ncbi:hypothetical protein COCNU_14G008290 [Cocos nucifera]|uniref:Uncharacterized protein n=1 Tax=Cocos nucifera TaxID=13894 RepID=A0A8K0IVK0_COCNU|nr:hypothetical protein COCNU_14G008290 [Cocos nucifera]
MDEDVVRKEIGDDGRVSRSDLTESNGDLVGVTCIGKGGDKGIEEHDGTVIAEGRELAEGVGSVVEHCGLAVEGDEAHVKSLTGNVGGVALLFLKDVLNSNWAAAGGRQSMRHPKLKIADIVICQKDFATINGTNIYAV